ncbi:MAG TPA: sodium:calcium antiporter, partial [Burkholderiaceae bacterium]|nr:sodium:calcium antiporter [Burkholderiaceae bacterium]
PDERDLGVGAAMGGPLVLATLAYAVVGAALAARGVALRERLEDTAIAGRRMNADQALFLGVFAVKVTLGLVVFAFKPALGVLFILAYAAYVWREVRRDRSAGEASEIEPLKLRPSVVDPGWAPVLLQTAVALGVIAGASQVFVAQLQAIGTALHWAPYLVALLLSPVATELPEIMNAVIWVRQGKQRLALANISGSMMIQATIPSALGIFFTPWRFDAILLGAGFCTALAIVWLWWLFRRRAVSPGGLVAAAAFYLAFGAYLLLDHGVAH